MVNDHYPYQMAILLGIYPIFRQTHEEDDNESLECGLWNIWNPALTKMFPLKIELEQQFYGEIVVYEVGY